jgi:hypothetical protein
MPHAPVAERTFEKFKSPKGPPKRNALRSISAGPPAPFETRSLGRRAFALEDCRECVVVAGWHLH